MTDQNIPYSEIQALIQLVLGAFESQFQRKINPSSVNSQFITPRVQTRIGFEINTTVQGEYFKLRLYAERFVTIPNITPFRLEEVQNQPHGPGIQVFVSISDLPEDLFPTMSKTTNPTFDSSAGPFAIELEVGNDYIQLETGDFLLTEDAP